MQYLVTLIPFLVYCVMVVDNRYKYIWIALAVAGTIITFMLNTNVAMLNSVIAYTGLISTDSVVPVFKALNDEIFFKFSIVDIFCSFANNLQKITLICILPAFILRRLIADNKIPRWHPIPFHTSRSTLCRGRRRSSQLPCTYPGAGSVHRS